MSEVEMVRTELANRLRRIRVEFGFTGSQLARTVGVSQSKVSKLETGRLVPTADYVDGISSLFSLSDDVRAELLYLAEEAGSRVDARVAATLEVSARQREYQVATSLSTLVRVFSCMYVPGILQIPDYVLGMSPLLSDDEGIQRQFTVNRVARQAMLYDTSRNFRILFSESALQHCCVSSEILRRQVDFIVEMSLRPNITIGLIPIDKAPPVMFPPANWDMFDQRLILLETYSSDIAMRGERDIRLHTEMFEQLMGISLTADVLREYLGESAAER
jgi:transcriptional regulator with XRE-family HTH domain